MLGSLVHIISAPELMSTLQRRPKAISLWIIEATFTCRLGGVSRSVSDHLQQNLKPGSQGSSPLLDGLKATHEAMTSRDEMDNMARVAGSVLQSGLDKLEEPQMHRIDLWKWVQHEITRATTECIYGPSNPYRDEKVEEGFW
jgi:hypothetical protein